jgi:hypothetical protein
MNSSSKIKDFILDNITLHQKDIILTAIQRFGVSRQAVLKHMHTLIEDNQVLAHGKTRDRTYELMPQVNLIKTIKIDEYSSSEKIFKDNVIPHLTFLSNNIRKIIQFSMAALINNILDHANATKLYFKLYFTHNDLHIIITDNGEGIFGKIKSLLFLENTQIAAIELAKGWVTTDPENHSGDDLKAVIHLFDTVKIESNGKSLSFINKNEEWMIEPSTQQHGTRIHLKINPNSNRSCEEIFKKIFNLQLSSVRIPINLLKLPGDDLVNSRVQANRILRNIKNLKIIEFDFNNIDLIGPAFADELIRKTKKKNRIIDIQWINSNKMVDLMMSRALNRFS